MQPEEVKESLKIYNDIPQMIAEEFATIRNCEYEKSKITLPSSNISGTPGGKGVTGDRTANTALSDLTKYFEDQISACYHRIAELRQKRNWVRTALDSLERTDRLILQLAYIGPTEPIKRLKWRPPTWSDIAHKVNYSESQIQRRATKSLFRMSIIESS